MKVSSICVVSTGFSEENLPLQPWRYLYEVGRQLHGLGYTVTFITDGSPHPRLESLDGIPLWRMPGVRVFPALPSHSLESILSTVSPDLVLLNVGLTSFLHQSFRLWRQWPAIGIFTSPIYTYAELLPIGLLKLWRQRSLSLIHLVGALSPHWLLHSNLHHSGLRALVVQTETMRRLLLDQKFWLGQVEVIPPGVDEVWTSFDIAKADNIRHSLGYTSSDFVVGYFGSPSPLRGLPLLIQAVDFARRSIPSLKLLILSRRRLGVLDQDSLRLQRTLNSNGRNAYIKLVDGILAPHDLVQHVASCDLVALPFELVPSDAPLSVLEVKALGLPFVTTRIACLPELSSSAVAELAEPGSADSLASALLRIFQRRESQSSAPLFSNSWGAVGVAWSRLVQGL